MKQILILGSGFAGIQVARTLLSKNPTATITIINDTPYHSFHADLYEVATALLPHEKKIDFSQLAGTVNIPLRDIYKGMAISVVIEQVHTVDVTHHTVTTNKKQYPYDFLVIALGSVTNYFGVPGAREYAHPFKTTEDALNIRNDIEELVSANDTPNVLVVGGGLSGVEVAAQMTSFMKDVAKKYHKQQGSVMLIEASDSIMQGTPRWMRKIGSKKLTARGVTIKTNTKICNVSIDNVLCEGGEKIPFDYLIWTAGIQGNDLEGNLHGFKLTSKKQIPVRQTLQIFEDPYVYAVGDIAYFSHNDRVVPATAWAAIAMGKKAGENIATQQLGNMPHIFIPQEPMFVVPLGKKQGAGIVGNIHFAGVGAWSVKRLISLKYFSSLLSLRQAFTLWRKGVNIFIHND